MTVTINGTTGVTTPDVTSDSYTGPISVSASAPDNSVVVDAAGSAGLGVTPSAWDTSVMRAVQVGTGAAFAGDTPGTAFRARILANAYYGSGAYRYIGGGPALFHAINANSSTFEWHIAGSGTAGNAITFTEAMTLNSSGLLKCPAIYTNTNGAAANVIIGADGFFYRSTSSLKYKRDIQDQQHGLADVMKLRPVTYKGNSEADGETVYGGLIAEEVHAAGLTEFVQYADDGSPDALAYSNMVSLCIKAIQEQQSIINELKADVAALKGQA